MGWPDVFTADTPCMLTEEKGYIVYSSLGSFFIPLILILFLYFKIFLTQRQMMAKKKKKLPEEGSRCRVDEVDALVENGEQPADGHLTRSTKEARKKQRRHILALVKEKHSIMYKKSRANGSQSGGIPDCTEDLPSQELLELPSSHERVGPSRGASESRNKSKEQKVFLSR